MGINDQQTDNHQTTSVIVHPDVLELAQLEAELEKLKQAGQVQGDGELARLGNRIKQLHQQRPY